MKSPEPAQFGNKVVHDVGSGCFGIFRSEPFESAGVWSLARGRAESGDEYKSRDRVIM